MFWVIHGLPPVKIPQTELNPDVVVESNKPLSLPKGGEMSSMNADEERTVEEQGGAGEIAVPKAEHQQGQIGAQTAGQPGVQSMNNLGQQGWNGAVNPMMFMQNNMGIGMGPWPGFPNQMGMFLR